MGERKLKTSRYNIFVYYSHDDVYIAFNCLSGGLYVFNNDHFKIINSLLKNPNGKIDDDGVEVKEKLISGRFLIEDDMDEMQILKLRNNMSRYNPNGIAMVIAPTLFCNLDCPYCYVDREKKSMSSETVEAIKKYFNNRIESSNGVSLSWTGGEPLLALDIVEELNNFFRNTCDDNKKSFDCSIVTNGVLLTPENVDRLKACGLKKVQVTLDGTPEFHNKLRYRPSGGYTFDIILKNIVYASNHGIKTIIRCNLEKNNYKSVFRLIDILADSDLNIDQTLFAPCAVSEVNTCKNGEYACSILSNREFSQLEPDIFFYSIKKGFHLSKGILSTSRSYCGANTLPLHVIDSYGNVMKCWCNLGRADRNMVGKINKDGGVEYSNIKNLARWMCWDPFEIDECRNCKVLPLCMGGCMYYNVIRETDQIDIGCSNRRHNLEQVLIVYYLSATKTKDQLKNIRL